MGRHRRANIRALISKAQRRAAIAKGKEISLPDGERYERLDTSKLHKVVSRAGEIARATDSPALIAHEKRQKMLSRKARARLKKATKRRKIGAEIRALREGISW